MTEREAFKVGFLLRCTERGLDPEQTRQLLKSAQTPFPLNLLGTVLGKGWDFGQKAVLDYGIPLTVGAGIGVPVAAGLAGGYGLAKLREDDTKVDQLQNDEMIDEYERLTAQIRRQNLIREMQGKMPDRKDRLA